MTSKVEDLARRRLLSDRQREAADRLLADWRAAAKDGRTRPGEGCGCEGAAADQIAAAKERVRHAWAGVGERLARPLLAVVIEDGAIAEVSGGGQGRTGKRASAAGLAVLRVALDALGDHYRIPE